MEKQFHRLIIPAFSIEIDGIDGFELGLKKLIEYSAYQIYTFDLTNIQIYDTKEFNYNMQIISTKEYINRFSQLIQKRIKIINPKNTALKINKFLSPLYNLDSPKILRIKNSPKSIEDIVHELGMDLVTIYFASKYECSTFITTNIRYKMVIIKELEKYAVNTEQSDTLSLLKGVFNIFERKEIECLSISPKDYISMKHRLDDILDDVEMINNSQHRHFLGIPSRIENSYIWLKKNTRNLIKNHPDRKYFSLIKSFVELGLNYEGIPIKIPQFDFYSKYCPPIYPQHEIYKEVFSDLLTPDQNRIFSKIDNTTSELVARYGWEAFKK